MEDKNTFGAFIKEQRLGLHMTLRDFCLKNHINLIILSKIERGIQLPKRNELRRLSSVLKILDDSVEHRELLKLYDNFKQEYHEFSTKDLPIFLPPDISEEELKKLVNSAKREFLPIEGSLFIENNGVL